MRKALLICDRCGGREEVDANHNAEGWRMLLGDSGSAAGAMVTGDLCPACNEVLMETFLNNGTPPP